MADGPRGRRAPLRPWVRALHRDIGYVAVGLTLVYALSGLSVNHIADWDPNFANYERSHAVTLPLPEDDDDAARVVAASLGIDEEPREVYRASDAQLDIVYERRTLHVDTERGVVLDEGQKPRFLLRAANFLHLNRGKKAWTYIADGYAVALLFLALSGLFMLPGRNGVFGRRGAFVLLGIALPVAYVALSGP